MDPNLNSTNEVLKMCNEIKNELATSFHVLSTVEIVEYKTYAIKSKYAGFCDIKAKNKKVHLQLRDYNTLAILEPSYVIATLLHEFAHCISPNCENPHDDNFYDTYRQIILVAKNKGLYNFTYNGNLKRIDNIDMSIKMGFSSKYPDKIKNRNMMRIQINWGATTKSYFYDDSIDLDTFIKNKLKINGDLLIESPEKLYQNCVVKVTRVEKTNKS